MKIAIFGDSFSARVVDPFVTGWPILLENNFYVENFSHSGSSEFRILSNIKNQNLSKFDQIIVCHTSPFRTFVPFNPLHQNTPYHQHCDIIFSDIDNRNDQFSVACQLFYKHIFDVDYAIAIHNMICREIDEITKAHNVLHITHFDYSDLYCFNNMVNFYQHWVHHRGTVNHYNQQGNNVVFQELLNYLR